MQERMETTAALELRAGPDAHTDIQIADHSRAIYDSFSAAFKIERYIIIFRKTKMLPAHAYC